MEHTEVAIGVDIGGTKIRVGMVDAAGRVCGTPRSIPTCAQSPGEQIVQNLVTLLQDTLQQGSDYRIRGIGVGCTGPLDLKEGRLLEVDNLPTLNHFPLRRVLEQELQMRVVMENDANALILAESLWGAGKGAESVLGITLGTGIGCAWIHQGKVWQGSRYCAGEIWTAPYRDGILEDYVSGNAVTRRYKKYTGRTLPAKEIAALALSHEGIAMQVWDEFAQALAYALSWLVNMLDPHAVVLGGSVVQSAPLFWQQVDSCFRHHVCRPVSESVVLKQAALGGDAGFMGAAALLF